MNLNKHSVLKARTNTLNTTDILGQFNLSNSRKRPKETKYNLGKSGI